MITEENLLAEQIKRKKTKSSAQPYQPLSKETIIKNHIDSIDKEITQLLLDGYVVIETSDDLQLVTGIWIICMVLSIHIK